MSSSPLVDWEQAMDRDRLSGSANWAVEGAVSVTSSTQTTSIPRWLRHASLTILLAASSVSSFADPWAQTRQQRGRATMTAVFRPCRRRRISAIEARRIALSILYRAEEERLRIAEEEAARGIDWEDIL